MKLSKGRRGSKLEINMTPMIDVTFLLLIFFMTVNQVTKMNAESLDLPVQKGSQDQSDPTITINVDRYGDIKVSGNLLTLGQLAAVVAEEIKNNEGDTSRVKVTLRADRNGNCRTVNDVMNLLQQKLDIKQVNLGVSTGQE
jgi:biopolymer transport protein ExbD